MDYQQVSKYSFFMSITIPAPINTSATISMPLVYAAVPTITIPEVTAITTDTLPSCISFIPPRMVNNITQPPTTSTAHCVREGTMSPAAAKKTGRSMVQRKTIWWAMAQGLEILSLASSVLMKPSRMPGMNSTTFLRVYSFSRMMRPMMMLRQKYLQTPILPPRMDYQSTAKMMPPVPFHPRKMLRTTEAQKAMHSILRCLSLVWEGRQGVSSYFRSMARQLIRKEMRAPMKTYCRMGMAKQRAVWMCTTTSAGTRIMSVKLERVILGQLAVSLYSKSCQSMPATMEASLLILGTI